MRPQGFPAQCLLCKVEVGNEEYNDVPKEWTYEQKYREYYGHFRQVVENINTLHTRTAYVAVACILDVLKGGGKGTNWHARERKGHARKRLPYFFPPCARFFLPLSPCGTGT